MGEGDGTDSDWVLRVGYEGSFKGPMWDRGGVVVNTQVPGDPTHRVQKTQHGERVLDTKHTGSLRVWRFQKRVLDPQHTGSWRVWRPSTGS